MGHTLEDKEKLILRIKRIRGQLNAAEKALKEEHDCSVVLHGLTACRGAMGGLISEMLEDQVYEHILTAKSKPAREQLKAAQVLVDGIKTYLK